MIILGIDPGTSCGFAVRYSDGRIDSGTWELAPRRNEGPGMRLIRLVRCFGDLVDVAHPDLVAVEEVRRHAGTSAAHVYGAIVGRIQEECERRKLDYTSVHWAQAKRLATGKGNADKAAMVSAANERWHLALTLRQDNEADARWIAEAAAVELEETPVRSAV